MLELEALQEADRPALLDAWKGCFGWPAPKSISRVFLRRFIGFELQARVQGGLAKETVRALKAAHSVPAQKHPKLGSQFFREWNGTLHRVDLVEAGYLWNGTTYRSLSAVAREITGARWSGPRFFGLVDGKST